MTRIISAVFDSLSEAEGAVAELRSAGVSDAALSVIARHEEASGDFGGVDIQAVKEKGANVARGALAGAGVGALLGIAALALPAVGPIAAAGVVAASAAPEAAILGAGAGALAGGLGGLLAKHGVNEEDARYYESRIHNGGVFVSVDTGKSSVPTERVQEIFSRYGGHSSSKAKESGN